MLSPAPGSSGASRAGDLGWALAHGLQARHGVKQFVGSIAKPLLLRYLSNEKDLFQNEGFLRKVVLKVLFVPDFAEPGLVLHFFPV